MLSDTNVAIREDNTIGIRVVLPKIQTSTIAYDIGQSIVEGFRYGYWTL